MKVPRYSYRIPDYYGDSDWHIVNIETDNFPLSLKDPLIITVDDDFIFPSNWVGVQIKSNYMWRYGFASITQSSVYPYTNESGSSVYSYMYYNRHYGTSVGSNGDTSVIDLGLGVVNTNRYYAANGNVISNIYAVNQSLTRSSFSFIRFSAADSWWVGNTSGTTTYPSESDRGIIVKFKNSYEANLPSDMYSTVNNKIVWNKSHPIYRLLKGLEVAVVRLY